MQFKHVQKIDVPAAYMFARMTNFKGFENSDDSRFSMKRQGGRPIQIGTTWDVAVDVRGRKRRFKATLSEMIPPRTLSYKSTSAKYEAVLSMSVTATGAETCRVEMLMVARSRSFSTALVFNTLRIARKRINKRMHTEGDNFAERIEAGYREQR